MSGVIKDPEQKDMVKDGVEHIRINIKVCLDTQANPLVQLKLAGLNLQIGTIQVYRRVLAGH
jgi:hypothetical protein